MYYNEPFIIYTKRSGKQEKLSQNSMELQEIAFPHAPPLLLSEFNFFVTTNERHLFHTFFLLFLLCIFRFFSKNWMKNFPFGIFICRSNWKGALRRAMKLLFKIRLEFSQIWIERAEKWELLRFWEEFGKSVG